MAMQMVLEKLASRLSGKPVVALLNNLGATTPLEMSILANELAHSKYADSIKYLIGPAPLMTSLDMHGFSVSVLPLEDSDISALNQTVDITAWPGMVEISAPVVERLPDGLTPVQPLASDNPKTRAVLEDICSLLLESESELNQLDAKSGDGDTGSTLAAAARALQNSLDRMPLADLTQLMPALGNELSQTMGGSSGVILAIFFNAAGDACSRGVSVQQALVEGLDRVSQVGGASVGDRTMIDALQPALHALPSGLDAAAVAAREGADATAKIGRAKAGRAAYVPESNLLGNNDPGAEAVARVFARLAGKA